MVRLSDNKLASVYGMTVSEYIRRGVLEQIETEYYSNAYAEAVEEHKKNPKAYALNEIIADCGKGKEAIAQISLIHIYYYYAMDKVKS